MEPTTRNTLMKAVAAGEEGRVARPTPSLRKAFTTLKKEAASDSELAVVVGFLYGSGALGRAHHKLTRHWFRAAAVAGHPWGKYNYAICLIWGSGGPRQMVGGIRWLRSAIDDEVPEALDLYATLLDGGFGIRKNRARAALMRKRAKAIRRARRG